MRRILTPDDLKKGDLADPGWHPAEIIDYDESDASEDAKNPGSTNCNFHFKLIEPSPNKGIVVRRLFNETALGFGKNLWKTLQFPYDPEKGYDLSTELFRQTIGHKLQIYIKRGKSNKGNDFNDVQDFRPLQ